MNNQDDLYAADMASIFSGYSKAHGEYKISGQNERGKQEGRAVTVRRSLGTEDWLRHLRGGEPGVGVIPLMDDCRSVKWGCIDIDAYPLEHKALEKRIQELGLPLVVVRSKSGGAHCFLFMKEATSAQKVVEALSTMAAAIGYGSSEIFPKQTARCDENDVGNWLNMPYFDSNTTLRYAYRGGKALNIGEFVEYALSMQVDEDALVTSIQPTAEKGGKFEEGPPCLQLIDQQGGLKEGTRNDGMFNVATYLRKRFPDNWSEKLQQYNVEMCDPHLGLTEMQAIQKSVGKKSYGYGCNKPPLNAFCNRPECLRRKFGIGSTEDDGPVLSFGSIAKYKGGIDDEVIWYWDVNGHRMKFTTSELLRQDAFRRKVANAISRIPSKIPEPKWTAFLDDKIQNAIEYELPEDTTVQGHFNEILDRFCTGVARLRSIEMLATRQDSAYLDPAGCATFRSAGFRNYLESQGFKVDSQSQFYQHLKASGAEPMQKRIGETNKHVWIYTPPKGSAAQPKGPEFGTKEF